MRFLKLLPSALLVGTILSTTAGWGQARPAVTGISHLASYSSDMQATEHYYVDSVGMVKAPDPENPKGVRYMVNATQFVEVLPLPANAGVNRLDHIGYNTSDVEGLRKYLAAKGWKTPAKVTKWADGSRSFRVNDPENNVVEFVQPAAGAKTPDEAKEVGRHIIHVGMLVHSREAEDKFYRALLDFKPYWFGGMVEGRTDWVSQQTPDGHDWLEYMLTSGDSHFGAGSGIPADISQQALGVLDHLSIGVVSVPDSYKKLVDQNRLMGKHDAHPQIGKDGKYQFNMYDPDGIRLEYMEFKAVQKPCCSPFTADDPTAE